jgi:adenylate cyclase
MSASPETCVACHKTLPPEAAYCPACGRRQSNGSSDGWHSERRLVTVLFADLADFTNAIRDADPEDVIDMLNQVFSRLIVECDREEGFLDKTVGDQLMVLFGAPRAHEDDPVRAVRAALKMQAAMDELAPVMREKIGTVCRLHIGINTGPVVWGEVGPAGRTAPTVIGDAVNLACRLQQLSEGGQILISEAVYQHTRHRFDFEVLDPIRIKGMPDPVPVYVPLRIRQPTDPSRRLGETNLPLLERAEQLALLNSHWSRAVAGEPQAVLVTGAAGLGKTRLISEFSKSLDVSQVPKQPLLLYTWCDSGDSSDYQPLARLLHQMFGLTPDDTLLVRRQKVEDRAQILGIGRRNLTQLMGRLLGWPDDEGGGGSAPTQRDPSLDHQAIETSVELFLQQSRHRPMLVIIDDLQWAHATSLEWARQLCSALRQPSIKLTDYRLMILLAARPGSGAGEDTLGILHRVPVPPLSEVGSRDLIDYLLPGLDLPPSLIERVSHESGGNPFYLIEVVRCLIRSGQVEHREGVWQLTRPVNEIEVPASVEGLVLSTLDTLPQATRSVLQHAAVIGMSFDVDLLATLTAVDDLDGILLDLEQRGLITPLDSTGATRSYAFTEKIVREVIYRSILRKTRRELHSQIASLTEAKVSQAQSAASVDQDIESLAYHYTSGGQGDKMITYNLLVGRGSLARFEFEQAYQHLQLAWGGLMQTPSPDLATYLEVAEALGEASTFVGDFALATLCFEAIRELIGERPEDQARYHYKVGRLNLYQGNTDAAVEYYQKALSLVPADTAMMAQINAEMRLLFDQI